MFNKPFVQNNVKNREYSLTGFSAIFLKIFEWTYNIQLDVPVKLVQPRSALVIHFIRR